MTAADLSALLLDLYRYSREMTLVDFQGQALERLRRNLHFDAAWWGVAHSNHDVHGSFPYNLPDHYPNFYLAHVSDTDALAEAALATPGETVRFGPEDFAASPGLSLLTGALRDPPGVVLCPEHAHPEPEHVYFPVPAAG